MPLPRRYNDAQTNRFEAALPDLAYRQRLARKHAKIKLNDPLPEKGSDKLKAYNSRMRLFQRYTTTATEKRSFKHAPIEIKRQIRKDARAVPLPKHVTKPKPKPKPKPAPDIFEPKPRKKPPVIFEPPEVYRTDEPPPIFTSERDINNEDLAALIAFHDGDVREASKELKTGRVGANLLEMAGSGVDIAGSNLDDARTLRDRAGDWFARLDADVYEDVDDFATLLHDLPAWQITMILDDLKNGETTFEDWIDAWRNDGKPQIILYGKKDNTLAESEFWALWRDMYGRSK